MSWSNNPQLVVKIIGKGSRKHAGETGKSCCYATDKLNIILSSLWVALCHPLLLTKTHPRLVSRSHSAENLHKV